MQEVIGVKFREASKVYYFDGGTLELKKGDKVLVDSAGGLALGTVAEEKKLVDKTEIEEPLKKVIRLATEEDFKKVDVLREKAQKQLPLIEEKIKSLNLDMNLVEAEYSFDESKITISYTSDGRVDFRELLKVLASALRVKIELRQIGTRDEVKIIGGLGLCGMPCCCTRFLKEPEHVTVKMVKNQNLSMSPTKTGGLCGRMMCCLAYEDKQYKEMAALLPVIGSFVTLPNGVSGTVAGQDILKQKFTLKIVSPDGSFKLKEFDITDLTAEKKEESRVEETYDVAKEEKHEEEKKPINSNLENTSTENNDGKQDKQKKNFHKFNKKRKFYKNKKEEN